jgi:hypothetical protein
MADHLRVEDEQRRPPGGAGDEGGAEVQGAVWVYRAGVAVSQEWPDGHARAACRAGGGFVAGLEVGGVCASLLYWKSVVH